MGGGVLKTTPQYANTYLSIIAKHKIWIDRVVREAKQNMYKHLSKLSWLIISQKVLDLKLQSWILNTRIFQLQHSDVPAFSIHWPCCSWGSTCSCRSDCKINPMQRRFYMISVDQTAKLNLKFISSSADTVYFL